MIESAFHALDTSKRGFIDLAQFSTLAKSTLFADAGPDEAAATETAITELFAEMDLDRNGTISLSELMHALRDSFGAAGPGPAASASASSGAGASASPTSAGGPRSSLSLAKRPTGGPDSVSRGGTAEGAFAFSALNNGSPKLAPSNQRASASAAAAAGSSSAAAAADALAAALSSPGAASSTGSVTTPVMSAQTVSSSDADGFALDETKAENKQLLRSLQRERTHAKVRGSPQAFGARPLPWLLRR
jgi:hypothetical protein